MLRMSQVTGAWRCTWLRRWYHKMASQRHWPFFRGPLQGGFSGPSPIIADTGVGCENRLRREAGDAQREEGGGCAPVAGWSAL